MLHVSRRAKSTPSSGLRACATALGVIAGAATVTSVGSGITVAHASAAVDRCGFATMIGVRGSGESPGRGTGQTPFVYAQGTGGFGRMTTMMQDYRLDPNLPIYEESLKYPASILPSLTDPNYLVSEGEGVTALKAEIDSLAADCPNTSIQLAGYSQGAHVIGDVLADKQDLSEHARAMLDGAVLFGDPAYRAGERWDAVGNGRGNGVFVRAAGAFDGWAKMSSFSSLPITMIRSWCVTDDRFCQNGSSIAAHESYSNPQTQRAAYEFLQSFLTSVE